MDGEAMQEKVLHTEEDGRPWIWKEGHIHCKSITMYDIKIAQVRNGFIVEREPGMPTYVFSTLDEVLNHLLFVFEGRKVRDKDDDRFYGKVVIERCRCCDEDDCCIETDESDMHQTIVCVMKDFAERSQSRLISSDT